MRPRSRRIGIAILLAYRYGVKNVSRWSSRERLAKHLKHDTFGTLAQKFERFAAENNIAWGSEVKVAAEDRNWLAHRYFWDRAVEFCSVQGRNGMLGELQALAERFTNLAKKVSEVTERFLMERGLTGDDVRRIQEELLHGGATPGSPRRLKGPVEIVVAYKWHFDPGAPSKSLHVFKTEKGENRVPSDDGLAYGPEYVSECDVELL